MSIDRALPPVRGPEFLCSECWSEGIFVLDPTAPEPPAGRCGLCGSPRRTRRSESPALLGLAVERLGDELRHLRRALPPQLGPMSEAARLTGLSMSTVKRRVKDGSIPSRKVGRSVLVDLAALRPLMNEEVARAARRARSRTRTPRGGRPGSNS